MVPPLASKPIELPLSSSIFVYKKARAYIESRGGQTNRRPSNHCVETEAPLLALQIKLPSQKREGKDVAS